MKPINIHDAKTQLSKLIELVMEGKEIVIAKAGKPVACLGPINKKARRFGVLKGKIKIATDFDAELPEDVLKDFEA